METGSQNTFLQALFNAAKEEDWDRVDKELIPQLSKMDGDVIAIELLRHTDDQNPNVRDVVASALTGLEISNRTVKNKTIESMMAMTSKDPLIFPSGRAAVFLLHHKKDEVMRSRIEQTLGIFRQRADVEGWTQELCKEIPELRPLLK